jgi:hypothetical protein
MDTLIQAVSPILEHLRDLREQRKQLERQIDAQYNRLISLFFEQLPTIYQSWRPRIGEQVAELNFCVSPPIARFLYVRQINGYRVRMAKTMQEESLFMVVDLDEGTEEYMEPVFVVPLEVYKQHFKILGFRELPESE